MIIASSIDWIHFFGRFHPVFLHLPIGLIAGWMALETLDAVRRRPTGQPGAILGVLCGLSAIVAAATGYMLSIRDKGYGEELLSDHLLLGLIFAGVTVVAAVVAVLASRKLDMKWSWAGRALLGFAALTMMPAAHHGGSLSHGEDFLSEHAPPALQPLLGGSHTSEDATEAAEELPQTVYAQLVQPVLGEYCGSCHAGGKRKGGFSFEQFEALLEEVEPGSGEASRLIQVMRLPAGDEDHMPPVELPQPSELQIDMVSWWINQGASEAMLLADAALPEVYASLLQAQPQPEPEEVPAQADLAGPPDTEAVAQLVAMGVSVQPVQRGDTRLNVDASVAAAAINAESMQLIARLAPNLNDLSLRRCVLPEVTSLAWMTEASRLCSLDLSGTSADAEVLALLVSLPQLERLVLTQAHLDERAVASLVQMRGLRKLYIWDSGLNEAQVARLREALPDCEINDGTYQDAEAEPLVETDVAE